MTGRESEPEHPPRDVLEKHAVEVNSGFVPVPVRPVLQREGKHVNTLLHRATRAVALATVTAVGATTLALGGAAPAAAEPPQRRVTVAGLAS